MARKIVGPTGSGRRRWLFLCTTVLALATAAFFITAAGAVTGSPSSFESADGNMTVQGNPATDWNCFQGKDGFKTVTGGTPAGCAVTSGAATQVSADSTAAAEITWTKGQKFDSSCPTLASKSTPPKDDFTNIAEYTELDALNNLFFYGASIRSTANGNTSGDVEFDQNGTFSANGGFGCRTAGDLLIAYDFTGGGTSLQFHILTWITSVDPGAGGQTTPGACFVKTDTDTLASNGTGGCWGATVLAPDATTFDGQSNNGVGNTGAINGGDNSMSGTNLSVNQFAEFGINLTKALGGGTLPCFPQQVWESRSSGSSFTSEPEDLEFAHVDTCGSIKIIKRTEDGTGTRSGVNKDFSYTSTGGLPAPSSFTLNDSTGSDVLCPVTSGTCNTQFDNGNVHVGGPYTVTETAQAGYTLVSLSCDNGTTGSTSSTNLATGTATINVAADGLTTCVYTNEKNTASLATQQSTATGTVFPGTGVSDTATVTGNQSTINPSGTVTFYLCGPSQTALSSCSSSDATRVNIGTGTLSGPSPATGVSMATSSSVNCSADGAGCKMGENPLAAGNYCFEASWPGDTNYPESTALDDTSGTNECFTVAQIGTTTMTTPSPILDTTVFGDQTVTDSALITADQAGGGAITGSVDFVLCSPSQMAATVPAESTCAKGGTDVGSTSTLTDQNTTPPSTVAMSAAFTNGGKGVNQTGTWCWRAVYTPGGTDGNNYTGSSDSTSGECFTVTDSTTSTSAQTWYPNDSASVSANATGDTVSGTLTIQLYSNADCGASEPVGSKGAVGGQSYTSGDQSNKSTITVSSGGQTTFGVNTASQGNYSWLVTFTSDTTFVTGSSHCESSDLTITN